MRTQSKVKIQNRYMPLKLSDYAKFRLTTIEHYKVLRQKNFTENEALSFLNVKRATLFRWLKQYKKEKTRSLEKKSTRPKNLRISKIINHELVSHILKIRQENPSFGKEKIKKKLNDMNIFVSSSTVGRILSILFKRGVIYKIPLKNKKYSDARKRIKKRYAQRIPKIKPEKIGQLIQIDHMVINNVYGQSIKEFRATCPITKITFSEIYTSANAKNGKDFLEKLIEKLDFKITSIQVDGGGEFMAEFEDYCKEMGIKLYVLPPRSPKMNGVVERTNQTYRYEFWNTWDIPPEFDEISVMLKEFEYYYNYIRPHQSLNYLTPVEYYNNIKNMVA